ncbi:MAG: chemotaxis protein CheW [Myxococcales bacterium]|nr:chemotaxis protein CheW [Myxococcales bacterium]
MSDQHAPEVFCFRRADRQLAVAARDVRVVIPSPKLSGFPTKHEPMLGVFAHRGRVFPLLDVVDGARDAYVSLVAIVTSTDLGEVGWAADSVFGFAAALPEGAELIEPSTLARRAREAMRRSPRLL